MAAQQQKQASKVDGAADPLIQPISSNPFSSSAAELMLPFMPHDLGVLNNVNPKDLRITLECNNADAQNSQELLKFIEDLKRVTPSATFNFVDPSRNNNNNNNNKNNREVVPQPALLGEPIMATNTVRRTQRNSNSVGTNKRSAATKGSPVKTRKRKKNEDVDFDSMTEEEIKAYKRRESNRLAAAKCRQKRKETIDTLEESCDQQRSENKSVQDKVTELLREVRTLEAKLKEHNCVMSN